MIDPQFILFLLAYACMLVLSWITGTLTMARWWPGFLIAQWYAIALAFNGHIAYGALSVGMALWWPRKQSPDTTAPCAS